MKVCVECRQERFRHMGRGLCPRCHQRARRAGRLDDYPLLRGVSREVVLEEWPLLRSEGHTVPQAAARLNMSPAALWQALNRARKAGDPRAQFDWTGIHAYRQERSVAS